MLSCRRGIAATLARLEGITYSIVCAMLATQMLQSLASQEEIAVIPHDADATARLPIQEGCFSTYPAQGQNGQSESTEV